MAGVGRPPAALAAAGGAAMKDEWTPGWAERTAMPRLKPRLVWPINSIRVRVNGGRVGLLGAKSSAAGAGRGGWVQLLRGSAGGLAAASERCVQLAAQLEGMAYLACSLACRSASSLSAGQRRGWKIGRIGIRRAA